MPTRIPSAVRKAAFALAASTALLLSTTACTGQSAGGADDDASKETTLTFWHAWSAPGEVKAVQALVDGFEKAHPNIHVTVSAT